MADQRLINEMKTLLGTLVAYYTKAHNYHWNVTGPQFIMFHEFFGDIYEEVYGSIDPTAEQIRQLDSFAPGALSRFQELSLITDETSIPDALTMVSRLASDNNTLLTQMLNCYTIANAANEQGLVNFLAGRIEYHKKLAWFLKSFQG